MAGFFESTSGYRVMLKEKGIEVGEEGDPVKKLKEEAAKLWGEREGEPKMTTILSMFAILLKVKDESKE